MKHPSPATQARQRLGLSLDLAARKLRITPRTLREYEAGRGKNLYRARKIAQLYKCPLFGCFTEQGISSSSTKPLSMN